MSYASLVEMKARVNIDSTDATRDTLMVFEHG